MLSGFRDFVMRGNVVDLAVGVVTGAAFGALVTAFTDAFLNPLIKLFTGGAEVGGKFIINGVAFNYGAFLTSLITFFLTMWAIYTFVVPPYGRLRAMIAKPVETGPAAPTAEELLTEIRDELKRRPL